MIKKLAHVLLLMACTLAGANEIYTCEKNGSKVYQNWQCDKKPAIERPEQKKNNYPKIVECGMKDSFERITTNKKNIKNCKP